MRRLTSLAAIALGLTTGCYSVEPLATLSPTPGTRLALSITDAGRVALGGSMGPEIGRVEGNLLAKQDSTYVLSVIGVDYLDGTFQKWKGETVRINSSMVSRSYEKRFSRGRTIAFLAGATAVAFLAVRSPFGPAPTTDPDPIVPPSNEARYPNRIRLRLTR